MPTITKPKPQPQRKIVAALTPKKSVEQARLFLGSAAHAAVLRAELTYWRVMRNSRDGEPLPAHIRAELDAIELPARRLAALLEHLPTDFTFRQPVPTVSMECLFLLRGHGADPAALRPGLQKLLTAITASRADLASAGRSDGAAVNRRRAELRAALRDMAGKFFDTHAAPRKRTAQNREAFSAWVRTVIESRVK